MDVYCIYLRVKHLSKLSYVGCGLNLRGFLAISIFTEFLYATLCSSQSWWNGHIHAIRGLMFLLIICKMIMTKLISVKSLCQVEMSSKSRSLSLCWWERFPFDISENLLYHAIGRKPMLQLKTYKFTVQSLLDELGVVCYIAQMQSALVYDMDILMSN